MEYKFKFMTNLVKPIRPLFTFVFFRNFTISMEKLKNLSMPEIWNFPPNSSDKILFNYIHHTFKKLQEENKIVYTENGNYACFNTGLVTEYYERIYAFLTKNKSGKSPYFFIGWFKESDADLTKFNNLPETANYFSEPSALLYDPNLELRVDFDHILADNFDRFPIDLIEKGKPVARNLLMGAIDLTKRKIKMNYKTAIPQYFEGKIQLLLPLCLKDNQKADLALVSSKNGNFYTARTCLTLEMAYNNARLIAKPDQEWLKNS